MNRHYCIILFLNHWEKNIYEINVKIQMQIKNRTLNQ